jgi:hypothetical protein
MPHEEERRVHRWPYDETPHGRRRNASSTRERTATGLGQSRTEQNNDSTINAENRIDKANFRTR